VVVQLVNELVISNVQVIGKMLFRDRLVAAHDVERAQDVLAQGVVHDGRVHLGVDVLDLNAAVVLQQGGLGP
jgi:hypothetical protein